MTPNIRPTGFGPPLHHPAAVVLPSSKEGLPLREIASHAFQNPQPEAHRQEIRGKLLPTPLMLKKLEVARNALEMFKAKIATLEMEEQLHADAISPAATPLHVAGSYFLPPFELLYVSEELHESHLPISHAADIIELVHLSIAVVLELPFKGIHLFFFKSTCLQRAEKLYQNILTQRDQFAQDPVLAQQFDTTIQELSTKIQKAKKHLRHEQGIYGIHVAFHAPTVIATIWECVATLKAIPRLVFTWFGSVVGLIFSYIGLKETTQVRHTHREFAEKLLAKRQQFQPTVARDEHAQRRKELKQDLVDLCVKKQTILTRGEFNFNVNLQRVLFGMGVVIALAICALETAALFTGIGGLILFFPQIALVASIGLSLGAGLYYWSRHRPNLAFTLIKDVLASIYYPFIHMWKKWRIKSAEIKFWEVQMRVNTLATDVLMTRITLEKLDKQLAEQRAKDEQRGYSTTASSLRIQHLQSERQRVKDEQRISSMATASLQTKSLQLKAQIDRQQENMVYWDRKVRELKMHVLKANLADLGPNNWTMERLVEAVRECIQDSDEAMRTFVSDYMGITLEANASDEAITHALLDSTFAKNNSDLVKFIQARSAHPPLAPAAA